MERSPLVVLKPTSTAAQHFIQLQPHGCFLHPCLHPNSLRAVRQGAPTKSVVLLPKSVLQYTHCTNEKQLASDGQSDAPERTREDGEC